MKVARASVGVWILVAVACAGCGGADQVFGDADSGTEVSLALEETFDIELPEDATTGYTWRDAAFDGAILTLRSTGSEPADGETEGALGMKVYGFECAQEGSTEIAIREIGPGGKAGSKFTLGVTCK